MSGFRLRTVHKLGKFYARIFRNLLQMSFFYFMLSGSAIEKEGIA